MVRRRFVLLVAWVGVCLSVFVAAAVANAEPAKRIYAGVYLHDVTKFDQKDGVFDVDLELWAKWLGEFDPQKLEIANASQVERQLIGEEQDGPWHSARWRVKGTLRGEFPVHRFPFDEQTLAVVLELPEREGELVPDLAGSGTRERFSITGWLYDPAFAPEVGQDTYRSDLGSIEAEGRPTKVKRVAFEVDLRRPLLTAATKLFVPLLVILLVAVVALFVHPRQLDVRSGVGVMALLACFAFHFAVADTMPSVAYITIADVLFLVAYALCALLLCVSVASAWLLEKGRERAWQRLDKIALCAFPVILFGSDGLAIRPRADAIAAPSSKLEGDRPASSKKVLKIGVDALANASGGLASRGSNWGTIRVLRDGTREPVLVEEAPSIVSLSAVGRVGESERWIWLVGASESLHNLALAFGLVTIGALAASVGAYRTARTTTASSASA